MYPRLTMIWIGASAAMGMLLSACRPDSIPTLPNSDQPINLAVERQIDADAHPGEAFSRRLAADMPGFGGLWYDDASGTFQVAAKDVPGAAAKSDAIRAALSGEYPGHTDARARFHMAKYDFTQLADWRRQARVVFSDSRVTGLDLDERANVIAVFVSDEAARNEVGKLVESAGVPLELCALMSRSHSVR